MKTIEPYIEEVKTRLNITSYGETMRYLGMHKQAWTAIQKGTGVSEKNAIRIAQVLGIDPIEILAVSLALKAKNREQRDIWVKLARRLEEQRKRANFEAAERGQHGARAPAFHLPADEP